MQDKARDRTRASQFATILKVWLSFNLLNIFDPHYPVWVHGVLALAVGWCAVCKGTEPC